MTEPTDADAELMKAAVKRSRDQYKLNTSRAAFQAGALFALNTMRDQPAPAPSVLEDAARLEALHAAVTAIYLDDSSDFKSALGAVVRHLDPKLAGDLLAWPKRAFDISQVRLDATRKQGANHD